MSMFKLRSLFWKIFLAFWLANLLVLVATIFAALHMSESRHVLERHKDAMLRYAAVITYRHEHGQSLDVRRDFDRFMRQSRPRHGPPLPRRTNLVIFGPNGELVFGNPIKARSGNARIEYEFINDAGKAYRVVSDKPQPPRFVKGWLARMHSLGLMFILLASALVSLLLTWLITRPLKILGAHARHLAGGDFKSPMEQKLLTRRDEIGELAREFDSMAQQLGGMIESRQEMLHDVSHELRAPLARLQAAAALAQQRGADFDPATSQRVERECERMDQLLQHILDYARMDQQQSLHEHIDLNALLGELVADLRLEHSSRQITLAVPDESVAMHGNTELLRRALENVLRNACIHTAEQTDVEVRLARHASNRIDISIRDHGSGIAEQDLEQLFEPFHRAGGEMHGQGFGLGLSIAARAIRKHGGEIAAVNHPQGGLIVTITLQAG